MSATIKAIETRYRGYRFRSRLEARWAVFFDALDIRWEYEPEGFDLGGFGPYLPDFWLPQVKMYAEVKPCWPTLLEWVKITMLCIQSQRPVLILDGPPDNINYWAVWPVRLDATPGHEFEIYDCILDECHQYWLTEGRFFACTGANPSTFARMRHNDEPSVGVLAARSARFEFGENGGIQ